MYGSYLGNRREGGSCTFDGPKYATGGSHWSWASSGELVSFFLRRMRVSITDNALGTPIHKNVVLGSKGITISIREGGRVRLTYQSDLDVRFWSHLSMDEDTRRSTQVFDFQSSLHSDAVDMGYCGMLHTTNMKEEVLE